MKEMLAEEAKTHRASCPLEDIRQPPPHINPWLQAPIERREIISNPRAERTQTIAGGRDRLIQHSVNGRQVKTKMHRAHKTMQEVRQDIADNLGISSCEMTSYKFTHLELPGGARLGDVANPGGLTAIAHFTDLPNFSKNLTLLSLEEIGQTPRQENPNKNTPRQQPIIIPAGLESDEEMW